MSRDTNKDEATTKRRRVDSRKGRAGQADAMPRKPPDVIDLTTEDDKQDDLDQLSHDPMEIPAHLESDDYFQVLSLSRSASESDVKRAYRKLAVQWHPDKNRLNPRAEEVFKRISEAYEVLSDLEKRKQYEDYKRTGFPRGRPASTTEGFGFQTSRAAAANGFSTRRARDIFEAFFGAEDPFAAFYGGGQQQHGRSRRVRSDPFESMGFGGMGVGMAMPGFGQMGGMTMMDQFFSNGFEGMNGPSAGVFSSSTTSSSSMFTDENGNVIQQKTTTTKGSDGRIETVTEEFRNGKLVNSSSSATNRLVDVGRMQVGGSSNSITRSYQRRRSSNSRPKYYGI